MAPTCPAILVALLFAVCGSARSASAQACAGCTPLDDPSGPPYLGTIPLGLYPGNSNSPPPGQLALALQAASDVVPRDASGAPDPGGLVGFISIGMSNANQEFSVFEREEDVRTERNARLVVVDGAVGGQSAEIIVNRTAPYWTIVDQRVAAAGLDPRQVQVAWLKEADGSLATTSFPAHAETLEAHLRGIVRHLKDRFVNLQLCYLSSRIYGGYLSSEQRNEPLSYETGFAYRWLLASQIAGDPALNPDPLAGPVESAVLLWGPYLWANGTIPRPSDGLVWLQQDLEGDNVHPSALGEEKVATLLGGFFTGEATATVWHEGGGGATLQSLDAAADASVDAAQPAQNFGTSLALEFAYPGVRSYVRFDLAAVVDSVVHAKLSFKTPPETAIQSADVVVVSDTSWDELAITAANAPPLDGPVLGTIPNASRGTAVSLDVTSAVQAALAGSPTGALLSLGVRAHPGSSAVQGFGSRESVDPPRLVLTTVSVPTAVADIGRSDPAVLRLSAAPNPFNPVTTIALAPGRDAQRVVVEIFDVRGSLVRRLFDGRMGRGSRTLAWDGRDDHGRTLPGGVYVARARVDAGGSTRYVAVGPVQKLVLIR